jgi:two-component system phosphate regulon sensor histidine kinase PhoR
MQKEYLKNIITESKRMANLINDILMISRLEAGIRQEEYVKVNLLEICRQVATSVSPQASQQNISIQVEGNDTDFYANPNQMLELVTNIISNAVKYNKPSGSVKVGVFDEPTKVKLKVSDTGIGIPQESQSRIFERFYRVDKGRSKKIGGTGLGLSIVKHIVNSYNGKIALKSMEDVGTTITVTLYKPNSAH